MLPKLFFFLFLAKKMKAGFTKSLANLAALCEARSST